MKNWILTAVITFFFVASCKQNPENDNVKAEETAKLALVENLKQQVHVYPDSAGIRMRLVNALDSLRLYNEAIEQTDSLIKRDSANNGLWFTKGALQESNKDTPAAISSYEKAVFIYPSVEAQLSLANLYAETKNARALAICQSVSKLGLGREADASCDFIAGVYHSRIGNNDKALMLFDHAIKNNYTMMEAYMEKGFIHYQTKKYVEALKIFETAVTVNNQYADAYYWQAKCYEALGNKQEAIVNYQRSLGFDKNLKEAREALKRLS